MPSCLYILCTLVNIEQEELKLYCHRLQCCGQPYWIPWVVRNSYKCVIAPWVALESVFHYRCLTDFFFFLNILYLQNQQKLYDTLRCTMQYKKRPFIMAPTSFSHFARRAVVLYTSWDCKAPTDDYQTEMKCYFGKVELILMLSSLFNAFESHHIQIGCSKF